MLFIFALALVSCLIQFYLAVRGWSCVFAVLSLTALCCSVFHCCLAFPLFFPVPSLNLTALCQPLPVVCVPVPGIPSISALLHLVPDTYQNHALHIYALLIRFIA